MVTMIAVSVVRVAMMSSASVLIRVMVVGILLIVVMVVMLVGVCPTMVIVVTHRASFAHPGLAWVDALYTILAHPRIPCLVSGGEKARMSHYYRQNSHLKRPKSHSSLDPGRESMECEHRLGSGIPHSNRQFHQKYRPEILTSRPTRLPCHKQSSGPSPIGS